MKPTLYLAASPIGGNWLYCIGPAKHGTDWKIGLSTKGETLDHVEREHGPFNLIVEYHIEITVTEDAGPTTLADNLVPNP